MSRRVVMITGANRGLGKAIAEELAAKGWDLSLGMRRPVPAGAALVHPFEATEPASAAAWVNATVERFGRIDAIVNNAGIMIPKSVVDADEAELDAVLDVNLKGPWRLARAAWPHLAAAGEGRIVTIVSLSGKRVKAARSGLYSVSKFAALGLAHALRHAGWEAGVRSTAICPGFVATDMARGLTEKDPATMTQAADIARIVGLVLDLPNTASIAEVPVNCTIEDVI